jgi:hypothetical protein
MKMDVPELPILQTWYKPIWLELEEKFKSIVNVYKEFVRVTDNELFTVNYVKKCENMLEKFELELSIHVVQRTDFPALFEFHINPPNTPCRSEVAKECCGLVLEKGIFHFFENSQIFLRK